ncbi:MULTISPECIES: head decoration protein [Pseudomonas]|uniref:head decoration protein n=1 Tax=Pseudomonas TaxID=286 RepID=UPI000B34BF62|nr:MULTISPECIES: head decoration protein [Pseudomonas]PMY56141.1 head decoration protein [Pseudomonas sp. FW305-53]PMY89008.1 head decoration protein [Pseudomonas sp. FW303-C2]PMY92189.1 head decoration protein [Pseudomonas sp. FW305-62]PNA46262.1 head decoration protein [Pseudomonas sp. FW306-2-2C-A10BC]PNA89033.1 head decoration protein [Pseudomonas sp. MPR-R3B]
MSNPERQTYVPDQLSAGSFPVMIDTAVIAAGQSLKRGAVLGQVKTSGEYVLCASAATDGSEAPRAILDQTTDTSQGAQVAPIRLTGEVLGSQLTLGVGLSLAQAKAALRDLCLFIR